MYDIRRLRAFHAVAERRSFSAAALELGYAQSVVSHHVGALERELGVTLIDRGTRPVGLTDAGERLLGHAVAVLGQVAAAEDELRAVAGVEAGTLKVGAFQSACASILPVALSRFEADHPGVEVRIAQMEKPSAVRRLRSGDLDVAVVWDMFEAAGAEPDEGFERVHLADDPYRVALPAHHRLARKRGLRPADLKNERFCGPPAEGPSTPYRRMMEEAFADAGFTPEVTYVMDDVSVGRAFVAAGLAIALLPELAIPLPRPDIAVRPLPQASPFRAVSAIWLSGRRVPAVAPMVRHLQDAARERLGAPGPAPTGRRSRR